MEEPQESVVHKVCDTVSELGAELLDKGEWPELLPALQVRTDLVGAAGQVGGPVDDDTGVGSGASAALCVQVH